MSNYYQIFPSGKTISVDELQYYQNICVDSSGTQLQYIVSPEEQFPQQQALLTQEQHNVIVNNGDNAIIIEQPVISYPNKPGNNVPHTIPDQQYQTINDENVEFSNSPQVYTYTQDVQPEQQQQHTVVSHQQNQIIDQQNQPQHQHSQMQQNQQQLRRQLQPQHHTIIQQVINQQPISQQNLIQVHHQATNQQQNVIPQQNVIQQGVVQQQTSHISNQPQHVQQSPLVIPQQPTQHVLTQSGQHLVVQQGPLIQQQNQVAQVSMHHQQQPPQRTQIIYETVNQGVYEQQTMLQNSSPPQQHTVMQQSHVINHMNLQHINQQQNRQPSGQYNARVINHTVQQAQSPQLLNQAHRMVVHNTPQRVIHQVQPIQQQMAPQSLNRQRPTMVTPGQVRRPNGPRNQQVVASSTTMQSPGNTVNIRGRVPTTTNQRFVNNQVRVPSPQQQNIEQVNSTMPQQRTITQTNQRVIVQIQQQTKKPINPQPNDLDDLEDSITAAVLQKGPMNSQPTVVHHAPLHNSNMNPQYIGINEMPDGHHIYKQPRRQQNHQIFDPKNTYEPNVVYEPQNVVDEKPEDGDKQISGSVNVQNMPFSEFRRMQPACSGRGKAPSQRSYNNKRGGGGGKGRQTVRKNPNQQMLGHMHIPTGSEPPCENTDGLASNEPVREPVSARMLVILQNGEQRLITFTLPIESCTVQDLLEQVGIPFAPDTNIQCVSNPGAEIDYIVTVGQVDQSAQVVEPSEPEYNSSQPQQCQPDSTNSPDKSPDKPKSPEPPREPPARYIPGMLALCKICGYTGADFNKCQRCKRKFPNDPKAIPITEPAKEKENTRKPTPIKETARITKPSPEPAKRGRKPRVKVPEPEPEVLTLSSDEEGENENNDKESPADSSSIMETYHEKEPVIAEDMPQEIAAKGIPRELIEIGSLNGIYTTLECRTIRIGSFKYSPVERVLFTNKGLKIVSPTIDDSTNKQILHIQFREVVKILVHFGKMLPVIFIYTLPSCSRYVREQLHMTDNSNYYFDSVSKDESFKRITLLPEIITDEVRDVIKKLYGKPQNIIDELTGREANDILMKTCPRDRSGLNASKIISNTSLNNSLIRQILIYPPGKGGISINTEDFMCLAQDQFLNDVIIDFFLKYLCKDMLTPEQRNKTHVLSSFFYKRLTTKPTKNNRSNPADSDPKLSAAQKRHSRVKSWTKNVNIFEKDFIVIPINENSHWFLAIICFPGMKSPRTMLTNKPIDFKDLKNYTKKKLAVTVPEKKLEITIGATTITPVKQAEPIQIPVKPEIDPDLERDEAEGSDSELEMSDTGSEADEEASNVREGIKQPCILIFDSLAGGVSRSRVVATLRDYLTCELQSKTGTNESFNKENMKGSCPKIPQQNNFTDCGLYLLQYVEQFFKEPINDYRIPIKQLVNWFEEIVVTRKREEISNLLKKLVEEYNPDSLPLPDIVFPTLNGKLLEQEEMGHPAFYDSEENEIEEEFDDEECEEEETEEDLSHDMESECDFPDNLTEQSEKEILKTVNKRRLIISNDESVVPTKQLKLSDSIEHPNGIPKLNKKNLAKDNEKTFL